MIWLSGKPVIAALSRKQTAENLQLQVYCSNKQRQNCNFRFTVENKHPAIAGLPLKHTAVILQNAVNFFPDLGLVPTATI